MGLAVTTRTLSTSVSTELADKLTQLAATLDRSPEGIFAEALAEWADRQEKDHALILEGLADVEAGRLLDHGEVRAWVAALGGRPAS